MHYLQWRTFHLFRAINMSDTNSKPALPDRLAGNPRSPHHLEEFFEHQIGIRLNGKEGSSFRCSRPRVHLLMFNHKAKDEGEKIGDRFEICPQIKAPITKRALWNSDLHH